MKEADDCFALYSRKSRFTGKGESIENQIELCRAYICRVYGDEYAERIRIYEDEGFSGGNTQRPAFKRMMEDAKNKRFKAIVVYRLDRISRNIGDFSKLIEDLAGCGIAFISIREQFDTDSPMGRAMMYISSVFSQLERETIAERIRDNMHELAKTGRWLGGVTPTGYASESVQSTTAGGKTKRACRLTVIPGEAQLVREIFELFERKQSLSFVEAQLLSEHRTTKTGKYFTRFSIKAILQNPVYMEADEKAYAYFHGKGAEIYADASKFDGSHGVLAYNRTDQQKSGTERFLPVNEWMVSVGGHEGIIPSEQWIRAQQFLEENKEKAFRRPQRNEALLTGLIFCACGSRMAPRLTKSRKSGEESCVYACSMKLRSRKSLCALPNVNAQTLDELVLAEIGKLAEDRAVFKARLEKSAKGFAKDMPSYHDRIESLTKVYASNETKISGLIDALADTREQSVRREITKRLEALTGENEELAKSMENIRKENERNFLPDGELDRMKRMLARLKDSLNEMTVDEKRAAVRSVVRRVVWDGGQARLSFFGADDEEELQNTSAESGNTAMIGERISNEILMHFRSRKKTAGDVSLSEALDTDGEGNGLQLMDVLAVEDDLADQIGNKELCRSLREKIASCLDEREARIIRLRYGLEGEKPLTQLETAQRCKISRSYVSRLEKRALEKLRASLEGKMDGDSRG